MPAGACVIPYRGKRATVWYCKFVDASGRQVKERLGPAKSKQRPDGWTRRKAEAALRARLVAVEKEQYRKPERVTFASFARGWLETNSDAREHRRTTRADYRGVLENHLIPAFGSKQLAEVTTEDIDRYVAAKRRAIPPLGPTTLNQHLTRLHSIFEAARRRPELGVHENPVSLAERPRMPKTRWTILSPIEIADVMRAFDELTAEATTELERAWKQTAKAMAVAMQYAWLRRGELLGLKWSAVELHHPDGPRLHVRETLVRGHRSQPKTEDGERTIALDGPIAEELWQHRRRTAYGGDGDYVFCHPGKGTPVPSGYFAAMMKVVLARAVIERPMREFHDWRHTGITNAAAAGMEPLRIMQMAGHTDFKTTQRYIDLAGVVFSDEVAKLSAWYGATSGTKTRYQIDDLASESRVESGIDPVSD